MLEHQHALTGELTTGSTDSRQRLDTSVPTAKADFSMQVRSRSIMSSRKRLEQLLSFNLASRTPSGRGRWVRCRRGAPSPHSLDGRRARWWWGGGTRLAVSVRREPCGLGRCFVVFNLRARGQGW